MGPTLFEELVQQFFSRPVNSSPFFFCELFPPQRFKSFFWRLRLSVLFLFSMAFSGLSQPFFRCGFFRRTPPFRRFSSPGVRCSSGVL